jgi:hypothetical protein
MTMRSTPSHMADVQRMKVQAIREESHAESSKAAAECNKCKKSSYYLSLSDEDEESEQVNSSLATLNMSVKTNIPAPFPISLDKDDDVLLPGQLRMPRPIKPSFHSTPSQTSNFKQHKSPCKIWKHGLVKRHSHSSSPLVR